MARGQACGRGSEQGRGHTDQSRGPVCSEDGQRTARPPPLGLRGGPPDSSELTRCEGAPGPCPPREQELGGLTSAVACGRRAHSVLEAWGALGKAGRQRWALGICSPGRGCRPRRGRVQGPQAAARGLEAAGTLPAAHRPLPGTPLGVRPDHVVRGSGGSGSEQLCGSVVRRSQLSGCCGHRQRPEAQAVTFVNLVWG